MRLAIGLPRQPKRSVDRDGKWPTSPEVCRRGRRPTTPSRLEFGDLRIVQVRRRGKGCLSYVVGVADRAFVVDPSADMDVYLRLADEHGWVIERVFDTHLHADHLSGARALADQHRGVAAPQPCGQFRVRLRAPGRW